MSVSTRMGKNIGLLEVEVLAAFGRRGSGIVGWVGRAADWRELEEAGLS